MLRVLVLSASLAAAAATTSTAFYHDGRGSVRHHEASPAYAHHPHRDENLYDEHHDREPTHSNRRHWWSHDFHNNNGDDDNDEEDSERLHSPPRRPYDHYDRGFLHDGAEPRERDDNEVDDNGGRPDQFQSAHQIRQDTERFVSGLLDWVNELVSPEVAATLVVDTSFSLAKTDGASLQFGSRGSSGLGKLFPVIQKFVNSPQDVDLLEEDVQAIEWAPVVAKGSGDEVEGGIYAAFHISCEQWELLNVSISSSGSTPTIQYQPVENSGLLIDVSVLDGAIQVTEALGSIIGFIKRRHYPENVDDLLKNWTTALRNCAAAKTLAVKGAVGGGWTHYRPNDNTELSNFTSSSVGYTEAFEFTFPGRDQVATAEQDSPSGLLRANAIRSSGPATIRVPLSAIAQDAAAAYLRTNAECGQRPPGHSISCAGFTVMSQLQSFHHSSSSASMAPASQLSASHFDVVATAPFLAIVGVVALLVAVAMLTLRRRDGYHGIANQDE